MAGAAPNSIAFAADYTIKLASDSNEDIYDVNFNFPITIENMLPTSAWDINGLQVGGGNSYEILSDTMASVVLPYSNSVKFMKLFDSNGNIILSEDVSDIRPIKFSIGYGGNKIVGNDINVSYSLLPQPVKKLVGLDYNIILEKIG